MQLNDVIKEISIPLDNQEHIFSKSIADQRPYTVQTPDSNDLVQKLLKEKFDMTSFSVVPMITQGKAVGVMIVDNNIKHEPIDTDDIDSLIPLMIQAASAVQNIQLYKQTQEMSITDGLTELYNQRFFQQAIYQYVQSAQEKEEDLSVLVLDIDFFKVYNDNNGHLAGNTVLVSLAKLIKTSVNVQDVPCRFGGEEFVVILPKASEKVAIATAEKIRKSIEQFEFPYQNAQPGGNLTVSVGLSVLVAGMNSEMLLQSADLALYKAKKNGKNQVCIYERNEEV
jgi:diguanylate cyclase (GGDEF)-like protein